MAAGVSAFLLACGGLFGGGSREFDGPHTATIQALDLSVDLSRAATASEDRTGRVWTLPGMEGTRVLPHDEFVVGVAFSPDGARLATASVDGVKVWSTATWEEVGAIDVPANAVDWAGATLAVARRDRPDVDLHDGSTLARVRAVQGHAEPVLALDLSADGSRLLTGSGDGTARLWDVTSGAEVALFAGHKAGVISVAIPPDGSYVVTGSIDKSARIWDVGTGEPRRALVGHTDWVSGVDVREDGMIVATVGRDGVLRLWDASSGASIEKLDIGEGPLEDVRFSGLDAVVTVGETAKLRGIAGLLEDFTPGPASPPPTLDARCAHLVRCARAVARLGGETTRKGGELARMAREMDLRSPELCTTTLLGIGTTLGLADLPADCQP